MVKGYYDLKYELNVNVIYEILVDRVIYERPHDMQ